MIETPQDHDREGRPGLGHLLRSYWRRIAALSATSFVGGALEATFLLLLTASALAITSGDGDAVTVRDVSISTGQAVAISVMLVLLRVAAGLAVAQQSSILRASVLLNTRRELANAYLDASWAAQHGQPPGKLQELLTQFAERKMGLVQNLTNAATAGSNLVAMLATAAIVEPFGFIVTVFVLVVLVAALRPLRKLVRRRSQATAQSGMAYATAVSETSQVGLEMHTFLVHDAIRERLDALARKHTRDVRRVSFVQGAMPVVYIGIAYFALIGGLAVVLAAQPSDVAALGAVMIILLRSLAYGQNLQVASAGLQSGVPFLEVLDDELRTLSQARKHRGGGLSSDLGAIEFQTVSFSYDGTREALSDFSAVLGPCETVGVIGPSGSGKSTFVQLLLGLREPTSGRILANGQPINGYQREFWARRVTFVPQQPRLVAGTIEDNVRFYRKWISREDVERACRLANLQPDIDEMPLGLDTNVGEQGSRLSGGQQQRLVIARALTETPDLLVLDEPTSALDVKSEHLIRQTMSELGKSMSIVIVAHRLSTLDVCDRIMVIRDGHLIDFDTPQVLLSQSNFYKEVKELSKNHGSD